MMLKKHKQYLLVGLALAGVAALAVWLMSKKQQSTPTAENGNTGIGGYLDFGTSYIDPYGYEAGATLPCLLPPCPTVGTT